ncbi:MAG: hypothetical protein K2Z81_01575, partial [Cyanobacteria bacterium]|nr:hypothetical protein [Cyanobacteriota bacterium]
MGSLVHTFVSRIKSISREDINRLLFLFGLVYFSQGIAQAAGLINQPLMKYLEKVHGLNAPQATALLGVLTIPWMIKPVYGLISDFIPLFGYRRKTWLVVTNSLAAIGFLCLFNVSGLSAIVLLLSLTAIGTAASDVIVDALMVENGQRLNATGKFQAVQWTFFFIAMSISSFAGGYLAGRFESDLLSALHIAALITAAAPALVIVSTWFVVKEEKVSGGKQLIPYLVSLVAALAIGAGLVAYLAPAHALGCCLALPATLLTVAAVRGGSNELNQLSARKNLLVLVVGAVAATVGYYLSARFLVAGTILGATLAIVTTLSVAASLASGWAIIRQTNGVKGLSASFGNSLHQLSPASRLSVKGAVLALTGIAFACLYGSLLAPQAITAVL